MVGFLKGVVRPFVTGAATAGVGMMAQEAKEKREDEL